MGRNRSNATTPSLMNRSPGQQFSGGKRSAVGGQYLPIMPKGESPTPSDLGYSSPTRPISQEALLMSPPSLISPCSLANSNIQQTFSPSLPQTIQGSLHQGLSPYHPLNSLILAAQLHPQYSLLSLSMSQVMSKAAEEKEREERGNSVVREDDDDDQEPGELVIKEESKEDDDVETRSTSSGGYLFGKELSRDVKSPAVASNASTPGPNMTASRIQQVIDSVNSSLTKHQFQETINHASADSLLRSSSIADDLRCSLCHASFSSTLDIIKHTKFHCPRLGDVSHASEQFKGRLIEGLAAKLQEMVGSSGNMSAHQHASPLPQQSPQSYTHMHHDTLHSLNRIKDEECSDADSGHVVDDEEMTSDGKKVRVRSHIREEQLVILRAYYARNTKPKKDELQAIADKIKFPVRVVQVWFQNARARDRKEARAMTPIPASYSHNSSTTCFSTDSTSPILPAHHHPHTSPLDRSLTSPTHLPPPQVHNLPISVSPSSEITLLSSHEHPSSSASIGRATNTTTKSIYNGFYHPSMITSGLPYPLPNNWSPTNQEKNNNNEEIEVVDTLSDEIHHQEEEDDAMPLDLSTKKQTPPTSPKPLSVVSDSDGDTTASLAISYKSESRSPTPPSINNNFCETKEDIMISGLPTEHSKLAQILRGAKLGLPHSLYAESYECSEKRPRVNLVLFFFKVNDISSI